MVNLKEYDSELSLQYKLANDIIKQENIKNNELFLFDIDDTMLSSMKLHQKGILNSNSSYKEVIDAYLNQNVEAIKHTLDFYNLVKQYTDNIVIVTGRPNIKSMKEITVNNLISEGYDSWKKIFFCPFKNNFALIKNYKTRLRKRLEFVGYKIFMNIGDQESDFHGGYSKYEIKLPNPMYSL